MIPFHEYFHGDNGRGVGASHQTGWTGLVAKLLQQSGMRAPAPAGAHRAPGRARRATADAVEAVR